MMPVIASVEAGQLEVTGRGCSLSNTYGQPHLLVSTVWEKNIERSRAASRQQSAFLGIK
jgi:hypothetical protein